MLFFGNVESFKATPNRTYYDVKGFNTVNNRLNPVNENNSFAFASNTVSNFYNPNKRNVNNIVRIYNNPNKSQNQKYNEAEEEYFNNLNPEESQNDYELSSINNVDDKNMIPVQNMPGGKYSRSPEPRDL